LLGTTGDLGSRPLPSRRIEFCPEPDDFRGEGYGYVGELPKHVTNLWIDRDDLMLVLICHRLLLMSLMYVDALLARAGFR
jgi:hypothetical protein